ncbi:hypothetical protein [Lysobacter gummosus]|uniref:Sel1 repeat family protein n=1 Tax=Lysobacter gummosus TaxID=262324 RepID=A0ABY3XB93_9GAMM|nr:hypothetical protein [Lysobacter gummosus]UNP29230.1 hypothetical protein MOV92_22635 [Lysobacter gummosus]
MMILAKLFMSAALAGGFNMPADELNAAKKDALSGSAEAAKKLYEYYERGRLEYDESFKWLTICAENGDMVCEYNLGFVMARKPGEENALRGHFWLARAAAHGNQRAVEFLEELKVKKKL